ncbi:MAG: hypothetical protein MUF39_09820, partial [Cyclobacteriaceae bacterium]|nr:hypothetical protein [Cyclobacteriaceae bacterium]
LTRIKTIERTNTFFDENTEFKTKYRSLKIQKVEINKIVAKIKADSIIIQVPITTDFSKTEIQKSNPVA